MTCMPVLSDKAACMVQRVWFGDLTPIDSIAPPL